MPHPDLLKLVTIKVVILGNDPFELEMPKGWTKEDVLKKLGMIDGYTAHVIKGGKCDDRRCNDDR